MRFVIPGTLAWGALAFGAVYPWASLPIAAVAIGLFAWQAATSRRTFRVTAVGVATCAVVIAVGLQLVPMSPDRLATISPGATAVIDLRPSGDPRPSGDLRPRQSHPLSVAPNQTAMAFAALLIAIVWTI